MKYSDYQQEDVYDSKHSGSAIRIVLYKSDDPLKPLIGELTGINKSDDFEQVAIEEAGEDGVDEIVTGRHSGSLNLNGFWTPKRNDALPQRSTFLGNDGAGDVEFTIMEVVGDNRLGEDTVLNVYVGCKCSRYGSSHGARGVKTFDLSFLYTERFSGEAWAAIAQAA